LLGCLVTTAAIVVEILSPEDETWQKLQFYAAHGVDEVLMIDPASHSVRWLAPLAGEYRPADQSTLLDVPASALAERIEWPECD
jgi:Uma2 family endonuclease